MKTFALKFLLLILMSILVSQRLLAQNQNLVGTWQGTLQPLNGNRSLRTVIKITRAPEDESLKGVMYSIDQGGQPITVSSVTQQGTIIKMSVPGVSGTYEGKLSDDGNTITGTWTQANPLPLTLTRATPETAWTIPTPAVPVKPMAADADPIFEVAVIKPSNPAMPGKSIRVNGRRFSTTSSNFTDLLTFAYRIQTRQIVNAPDWADSDKFDLLAQPDGEGQPNDKQWRTMMQKLLADRFKLTFHQEKRELRVYTLTISKSGPKLTKSSGDPDGLPGIGFRGFGVMGANNANMSDVSGVLQMYVLDRPVLDQTGISGRFDFTLTWRPDEFQFTNMNMGGLPTSLPANVANAPDLFSAMEQQLGLKLESTKAPADVIVIDHVEKPSEN